ncbi:hypothetical protein [Microcoleus sp. B9-D4]|uniref:hypothetical protein n=1 Tax=Microcoleus sp. B9-D4 TaxID=2818711 RepID=UPI002FD21743
MSSAAFLTAAFLAAAFLAAAFFPKISDDRKSIFIRDRRRWNGGLRDFNAPGRSIGYSAHRLHLLEACLVSVTEFTAGSSGFSIGFPK